MLDSACEALGGLLEVVQSHAQPYTVVSCKAWSPSAGSVLLLWLFPEPQRSRAMGWVHAHQPHAAGCFPREEVGGIGSTEYLTVFKWQGKSVKLHTTEVLKSWEVLNPDWRGKQRLTGRSIFPCWGVFKKSVFYSSPFSVSSWWSNCFHFSFHTYQIGHICPAVLHRYLCW